MSNQNISKEVIVISNTPNERLNSPELVGFLYWLCQNSYKIYNKFEYYWVVLIIIHSKVNT